MQFPCWIPVFIAIGILIGFNYSPISYIFLSSSIVSLFLLRFFCHFIWLKISFTATALILIGILAIQLRIISVDSPIIPFDKKFSKVRGRVDNIIPIDKGYRMLLSDLKINRLALKNTPRKIRLTVRTKLGDVKIGDYIKFNAILSKPMDPYLEDSYNFSRDAYFKRIGAVGYTVSEFKILKQDRKSFLGRLNYLRNKIQMRVNDAIGSYYGSIATALMINEYSNIDKKILQDLRATGLAHILSVSGMHLSLVAAIFFFSSRFALNCFESVALKIHCKKIAAIISLFGSLAYLLISGMEVAAVRSFIMTSMIIIAIIIDRTSTPMRAIAFAATIILLISPENIIHPSFQMSFAAVLALIACFELFSKIEFNFSEFNWLQKILFYLLSLSLASLVAGLATTPFALYHFNQSSNYSILANLMAVPITSFWLMPCVVLTFLLYPFHLEFISLYIMKYGIDFMFKIANYVANLPYSVSMFVKLTDYNLLIIVFGMIWFCLWQTRLRLIGIAIIIVGVICQSFTLRPDIFIDWEKKTVAVLDKDNRLIFLTKPLSKFTKQLLLNHLGLVRSWQNNQIKSDQVICKEERCFLHKNNYQVKINLRDLNIDIVKDGVFQRSIHKETGTSLIYLEK